MEVKDFKKLLKGLTEEDITFDEPHVTYRCEENNITKQEIITTLLRKYDTLVKAIRDRAKIYKLYFRLSRHRQLKIVADLLNYKKLNVRTVKILDRRYRIGMIKRSKRF